MDVHSHLPGGNGSEREEENRMLLPVDGREHRMAAFDIWQGLYSRASLDAVQLAFAIWGILEWGNKKQGDKDNG